METQGAFKSGYVSIIGEPNVGKSTLLNAMMGEQLAIVTPKPQTTRNQITGIVSTAAYQIVFLDTPGVLTPKYKLHDYMVQAAYRAIQDSDIALYVIDAVSPAPTHEPQVLNALQKAGVVVFLVLNKIDLLPSKPALLPLIEAYGDKFAFAEIVPVSAMNGDGIAVLRERIVGYLPAGPAYFSNEQISDLPERFFVAEAVREQIFHQTQQEIPYASTVVVDEFKERPNGKTYISAVVYVEKPSQKGVLIGKAGRTIKAIGESARRSIEAFLGARVYLELRVTVRENWRNDNRKLKTLGYS